jgi:hypothetical protein
MAMKSLVYRNTKSHESRAGQLRPVPRRAYGSVTAEPIAVAKRKRIPKVEEYGTTFLC